ncbi:MAG: STAS domain-containing protein [Burkholderiales bacterium]
MIAREGNRYWLEGPVTLAVANALRAQGEQQFEGDSLVVDFSRVTEVDSSALSLILEWCRHAGANSRRIVFANLGANLSALAELYGVVDLIPVEAR